MDLTREEKSWHKNILKAHAMPQQRKKMADFPTIHYCIMVSKDSGKSTQKHFGEMCTTNIKTTLFASDIFVAK